MVSFIINRPPNGKTERTNKQIKTDNNTNKRTNTMKKKILSITLVLAGLMGSSAMAQSPSAPQQATHSDCSHPQCQEDGQSV